MQLQKESLKEFRFAGIETFDLCNTGAALHQMS